MYEIEHPLSDGTFATVKQVMERTGLSRIGAYRRLSTCIDENTGFSDADLVWIKSGHLKLERRLKDKWISEPVRIAWGTPINPEYLDGTVSGNTMTNRDDKVMDYNDRVALAKYRHDLREEWRASSDTILNRVKPHTWGQ
tara:strand:- start:1129 stop:1548 length:420 start_codon:yes stop_codon:yes gene_type:complete